MKKRELGNTGLEASILGLGGFHLLELPPKKARDLTEAYIENGGNYIDLAVDYGSGEAEKKLNPIISEYRDQIIVTSKDAFDSNREKESTKEQIERSLDNLGVDYIDIYFVHAVDTKEDLKKAMSPGGALEAIKEAQDEGKIGNIGISTHGHPEPLIEALKSDEFDVIMSTLNYFDRFNYPKIEKEMIPLADEKGVGIIAMKSLADGFLWRSAEKAFRYTLSLPTDVLVAGFNNEEMLERT
mgnify:CR=1 FL=1